MLQLGGGGDFPAEPFDGRKAPVDWHHFHHHLPIETVIACEKHARHAPATKLTFDGVGGGALRLEQFNQRELEPRKQCIVLKDVLALEQALSAVFPVNRDLSRSRIDDPDDARAGIEPVADLRE